MRRRARRPLLRCAGMLAIKQIIRMTGATPGVLKKEFKPMLREAMQAVLLRWKKRYLPLHFQTEAYERYGYPFRVDQRSEWKKRRVPTEMWQRQKLPFVETGRTRERALGPATIKGTPKRATLRLGIPYYPYGNVKMEIGDYLQKMTRDEQQDLLRHLRDLLMRGISRLKTRKAIAKVG